MKDLNKTIEKTRKNYREIFVQSLEAIQERIDAIKPDGVVTDIFETYPENSEGTMRRTELFNSGLFAQQTNDTYNPNHPMVRGSETQARHLDLLA